jgi:lysophospholipase L1-like esterase
VSRIKRGVLALVIAFLALGVSARPAERAQILPGFAILGDSGSDEYRADDNRGGTYAATTLNWMELLVRYRGVNAGAWGTRPEPRRSGYAQNWARSGARASDVLSGGQASGVAAQVAAGAVSHVLLMAGINDFAIWNGTYQEIYNGSLAGQALTAKLNAIVADLRAAIEAMQTAGPVTIFLANVVDRGYPGSKFASTFPDPARRQIVSDAIATLNGQIAALSAATGSVLVDIHGYGLLVQQRVDANGILMVGGEPIQLFAIGDQPHHMILGDDEHAGTVASGLLANFVLESLNAHGFAIAPFTEEEIVRNAGIVGADIVAPSLALTSPVSLATVSGMVSVTAAASDDVGVAGVQFLLDGAALGSEDTSAPYSTSWSTSLPDNGVHTLSAIARDAAGNRSTAEPITITVHNLDTSAPLVSLTSPSSDTTVAGTFTISAFASDDVGVAGVTFLRDGAALGPEDTAAPYSVAVQTDYTQNGPWTLSARARDAAGNMTTSSPRTITVANLGIIDTFAPSSFFVTQGTHTSGRVEDAGSNDNVYLTVKSTTGSGTRYANTELTFDATPDAPLRLDIAVSVSSSASGTALRISAFNVSTGAWTPVSSTSVERTEVTRTASLTTTAVNYRDASGRVRVLVEGSRSSGTFTLSLDQVRLSIWR